MAYCVSHPQTYMYIAYTISHRWSISHPQSYIICTSYTAYLSPRPTHIWHTLYTPLDLYGIVDIPHPQTYRVYDIPYITPLDLYYIPYITSLDLHCIPCITPLDLHCTPYTEHTRSIIKIYVLMNTTCQNLHLIGYQSTTYITIYTCRMQILKLDTGFSWHIKDTVNQVRNSMSMKVD